MSMKRLGVVLCTLLGMVGMMACVVGIVVAVLVGMRLCRANDRAFGAVDRSLEAARDMVLTAQRRTKGTAAEDLGGAARDWGRAEIEKEVVARFDARAQQVAQGLQQAEGWVQRASATVQGVRQTLDVMGAVSDGITDGTLVDAAAELMADLSARLDKAIEAIGNVRERTALLLGEGPRQERIASLMKLTAVADALIGQIDERLGRAAERLNERRARVEEARVRTRRWILIAVSGVGVVFAWMGAGQVALGAYGWRRWKDKPRRTAVGVEV
jgi:hypothetical protein